MHLPLIIGYGGINSGGISSTDQAYRNIVAPELPTAERKKLYNSLHKLLMSQQASKKSSADVASSSAAHSINKDPAALADRFFIRAINQANHFDPQTTSYYRTNDNAEPFPISFAASLPDEFNPGKLYTSHNHPRSLQMAVFAANDALNSAGLDIPTIRSVVTPDKLAVYAGNSLGQLDLAGMGGVLTSMLRRVKTITKQLPFSYPQMSADFVNAYVLNNLGQTGNQCGACATFLYNLSLAAHNIKSGELSMAVVGTSEAPILPQLMSAFYNMGAMTSDKKLDVSGAINDKGNSNNTDNSDFSKASLPFGDNSGFVMGESAQFVILASEEVACNLGATIHGAVPDVFISADGAKRSISSPGPGNYITMGKAAYAAEKLLGSKALRKSSYVHAHGTSTPQNRVTESQILSSVASAFGIKDWNVLAIKSYLGHSQATAGGDQLSAALGFWKHGILPGISTVQHLATDVATENLRFNLAHNDIGVAAMDAALINAKGFGGNNATALLLSPQQAQTMYKKLVGSKKIKRAIPQREKTLARINQYISQAESGDFKVRYQLADIPTGDSEVHLTRKGIEIKGYPPIEFKD